MELKFHFKTNVHIRQFRFKSHLYGIEISSSNVIVSRLNTFKSHLYGIEMLVLLVMLTLALV